jgi:hypothetical protein
LSEIGFEQGQVGLQTITAGARVGVDQGPVGKCADQAPEIVAPAG